MKKKLAGGKQVSVQQADVYESVCMVLCVYQMF